MTMSQADIETTSGFTDSDILARRTMAFFVDFSALALLATMATFVVFVLGVLTLGLAFALFAILYPGVAFLYGGMTIGGPTSATLGMWLFGLEVRHMDGKRPDFVIGAAHTLLFYATNIILTPFVLLFALIINNKRLLHDLLLGVRVVKAGSMDEFVG